MVIKWGRNGHFLACTGYPECRNTKEFVRNADGSLTVVPSTRPSDQICPTCGAPMVIKRGRFGEFLACSKYPECKTTSPMSLGVDCPKPGCGGYLTEKRSRRGKTFFGCSNYARTKCDFVSWDRPLPQPCPKCGAKFVVQKVSKAGVRIRCVNEGCDYTADPEAQESAPPPEGTPPAADPSGAPTGGAAGGTTS
jgi:DNA topoisomerase-1